MKVTPTGHDDAIATCLGQRVGGDRHRLTPAQQGGPLLKSRPRQLIPIVALRR